MQALDEEALGVRAEMRYLVDSLRQKQVQLIHPGFEMRANRKSISHRCYLFEVAFVWELTKETVHLPLGCHQVGLGLYVMQI